MTPEENIAIVRKQYALINTKQLGELMQYISPNAVRHDLVGAYPELAGGEVADFLGQLLQASGDVGILCCPLGDVDQGDGEKDDDDKRLGEHQPEGDPGEA